MVFVVVFESMIGEIEMVGFKRGFLVGVVGFYFFEVVMEFFSNLSGVEVDL